MYNGYYDNDNFDAAKFLDEQMIDAGYALAYDGGTKDKNFSVLLEKRKTK